MNDEKDIPPFIFLSFPLFLVLHAGLIIGIVIACMFVCMFGLFMVYVVYVKRRDQGK